MAITNKLVISKILGRIKDVEGETIDYTDILLNNLDKLCEYLVEVFDNGVRKLPTKDYGVINGITYHSPSNKVFTNFLAAKNDCKKWLKQPSDKEMTTTYFLLMSMTNEELETYLQRFDAKGDIFYESCTNKNN